MNKIWRKIIFFFFTIPIVLVVGLMVLFSRLIGFVRVSHPERIPKKERRIIVVCNHKALAEVVIGPAALFFVRFLRNPLRIIFSTPDWANFFIRWYWFWIRPISVPVKRGDKKEELKSLFAMKEVLMSGNDLWLFPEGRRTFRGTEFVVSPKGNKISKLKEGVGWLVARTKAWVLPVWINNTDVVFPNDPKKLFGGINIRGARIEIKVGKLTKMRTSLRMGSAQEITREIEQILLDLADEE